MASNGKRSDNGAILVTGGAGYIGSHIVLELLEAGEKVIVVDNLSRGVREAVPACVPFYKLDVDNRNAFETVLKRESVSAIIHMSAYISVPDSFADPAAYYRNNTASALTMLEAAKACSVDHIIFSSTAAVYGDDGESVKHEGMVPAPASPYGKSKWFSEQFLVDTSAATDISVCALRYFNVAGADPLGRAGPNARQAADLVRVACQAALGIRDRLQIFGNDLPTPDGTGIRDYIHVSDLASAHYCALNYLRNGGETLVANCGYGQGFSVLEVVEAIKSHTGPFDVEYQPMRPGDLAHVISDPSLIRSKLDWTPQFDDIDTIVGHALAWEKRLQSGQPRTPLDLGETEASTAPEIEALVGKTDENAHINS